ncbi:hypothetical protein NFI96_008056 [Prochilodus magdalenae]|nr:hypothetical protein NFI96_008056 [Prochilodus magdalenae]
MAMANGNSSPNSTVFCELPYENDRLPLLIVYSIVLIVGLPANIVTVYLTFLQVRRKNVLGIYLLSLSVCDLMYLGTLPMWTMYINGGHHWTMGSMACKVTGYVFFNNMYISIFLLCCVSVDRYVAVVFPMESRVLRKRTRAVIITAVIVAVVALGHMPVFTMSEGDTETKDNGRCFEPGHSTPTVTGFNYARFIIGFFIPLCVLLFTNHAVLIKVEESEGLKSEQKGKVRYLAVAVILFFLVCFAPYHVILLVRAISYHFPEWGCKFQKTIYTPYTISLGLSAINSAMNPVLYVLSSDNIRKEIQRGVRSIRSGSIFRISLAIIASVEMSKILSAYVFLRYIESYSSTLHLKGNSDFEVQSFISRFMCSSVRCSTSFLEEVMVENKNGQSWRSDDCYVHERQLVLSLCLDKLQGSRMPSLHRSVLLANTMRHIQWEITQEKECPPGNLCSRQIPQFQEARPLHVLESQFQAPDGISILSDIDLGCVDLACSRCAEKVEINMDVSYLPSAFVTSSSYTPFTDSLIGLTTLLEAGTTQGYLSDLALDDIFEDIDTSMYDSSEASSIMTCVFCSVSHLFGGDDETKVLRDCPSASPVQHSPTDLNDLDHIMEVFPIMIAKNTVKKKTLPFVYGQNFSPEVRDALAVVVGHVNRRR